MINHAWRTSGRRLDEFSSRAITILAVVLAWVPFRAESLPGAWNYLRALGGGGASRGIPGADWQLGLVGVLTLGVLLAPTFAPRPLRVWHAVALGLAFFVTMLLLRETALNLRSSEFIYFRF